MDDSTEHDEISDPASSAVSSLTGFLFGNIDEKGELQEDFLDEESKKHLSSLSTLGIGSMVKEITDDADKTNDDYDETKNNDDNNSGSPAPDFDTKASDAVDFSDITEMAEEEEEKNRIQAAMSGMHPLERSTSEEDYDAADEKDTHLMPPPSWLPVTSKSAEVRKPEGQNHSPEVSLAMISSSQDTSAVSVSESEKLSTPLAAMMPPELSNVDVTTLFPEFRPRQVLRFSRLFKPVHVPHVWKKKKKKKEEEGKETKTEGKEDSKVKEPG